MVATHARHPRPASVLAMLVLHAAALAPAGALDELFKVSTTLSAQEVEPGEELELTVTFTLGEHVHLYRDKIAFEWSGLEGAEQRAVVLPEGELFDDPFAELPGAKTEGYEGTVDVLVRFAATGKPGERVRIQGTVSYQGCSDAQCYLPQTSAIEHEARIAGGDAPAAAPAPAEADGSGAPVGAGTFLWYVAVAFGAGLLISLTPCVYPMIPITVAIVGGRGQRSKVQAVALSAVYVLGISLTYAVLGVLVAALGSTVRHALQSPWLLVPIAGLFVVLALAMFDVITLQTPGSVGGLAQRVQGKARGVAGILVLGVVSGLVAGPCVAAPLAGVLVRIAETGSKLLGFASMFALAWGMGLILLVAGASTSLLPKAGAWMEWVKRLLGFVLLWAAVYFVRPVIGERWYALGAAGVLVSGSVFLGCFDALTAASRFAERLKLVLGLSAVLLAASLVLPGAGTHVQPATAVASTPDALEAALEAGKPVMVDFYADWCAPCKELDEQTFADPRVVEALGRFQALKLDVDDRAVKPLLTRYNVIGPPTVLLFDADGTFRKDLSFAGFKGPDAFLKLLAQVR